MRQWGCRVLVWLQDAVQAALVWFLGEHPLARQKSCVAVACGHAGGGGGGPMRASLTN
jgi:hypothetical protein